MITVTISKQRLIDFGSDIHGGMHILVKLREAGIPALGVLLPMGVSTGVLSSVDDGVSVAYSWDGEAVEDLA